MKTNVKQKIKDVALKSFSEKGYYGTSIREIAKEAECSLPTVYYYFKNKEDLYEELAYKDFLELNERLRKDLNPDLEMVDMYITSVKQRINLKGNDKMIYTLAQKTTLGLDGSFSVKEKLIEWENTRYQFAHILLEKSYQITNPVYGNILSRVSSNIFLKALLYDVAFTENEVEEELVTLFNMIIASKK